MLDAEEKLTLLENAVRRMHEADEAYGCGFYSSDDWIEAYCETYRLVFGGKCPTYE